MVGIALSVASVFVVAVVLIHWFALARQAEQAAELSALAGAGAAVRGQPVCEAAGVAARNNGGSVSGCIVRGSGRHVVVEISVTVALEPAVLGRSFQLVRKATAASS